MRGHRTREWLERHGLRLGSDVAIGFGSTFDTTAPWLISVGDHTTISEHVRVLVHDAGPAKHLGVSRLAPVSIGAFVYIGAGVTILPGVTVGDGAIVGAGSVVAHDVAPRTVVAGVPARVIGSLEDYLARHAGEAAGRPWIDSLELERRAADPAYWEHTRALLADGHGYLGPRRPAPPGD